MPLRTPSLPFAFSFCASHPSLIHLPFTPFPRFPFLTLSCLLFPSVPFTFCPFPVLFLSFLFHPDFSLFVSGRPALVWLCSWCWFGSGLAMLTFSGCGSCFVTQDEEDTVVEEQRSAVKAGDANLEELEQMLREKALKSLKEAKQLLADDDNK